MAEGGAVALAALLQRQDGASWEKTLPCSYRAGIWM